MLLAVILLGGSGALSEREQAVASISGKHLRAIVSALPELERRHLSLENYEHITVFESYKSSELLIVSFAWRAPRRGEKGSPSDEQPTLEVEIDKRTNQVGKAHYAR
jgi:hypothetical protein